MVLMTLDSGNVDKPLRVIWPCVLVASHHLWVMAEQVTSTVAFQLVPGQLDDVNILERNNGELGVGDEVAQNVEDTRNNGEEHFINLPSENIIH